MSDLVGAADVDLGVQFPRLQSVDRFFQLLDGNRDAGGDVGVDHHQKEEEKGHHKGDEKLGFQAA